MTSSSSSTTGKDLCNRTGAFAKSARAFVRKTPRTLTSLGDCRQLIKASGAVGSSYVAADTARDRDGFLRNIFDCRANAKQSRHWLTLLDDSLEERSEQLRTQLIGEAEELEKIFGSIIAKMLQKQKKTAAAAK